MRSSLLALAVASAALPYSAFTLANQDNNTPVPLTADTDTSLPAKKASASAAKTAVETLVIVGEPMSNPIAVSTDPKLPRQPLPASDGADYLKTIPGFSLVRKGGASADPVFRGMAGSRLAIVNDGHSLLGGCGSRMDPPTAYLSPQHFDEIVVIKGPQSLRYGPALGTVLFNKQAGAAESELSVTMARFGRREVNADINQQLGQWQGRLLASHAQANDYQSGDGAAVNSEYQRWSVDGELRYQTSDLAQYQLALGASDGEAAYADRLMDGSRFRRDSIALATEHQQLTQWLSALRTQWYQNDVDHVMDNYRLREFSPSMMMKNPSASNPDRLTQGGRIEADLKSKNWGSGMVGVDGQYNRHRVRSSMNQPMMPYQQQPWLRDASFSQLGVFAEWQYSPMPVAAVQNSWHLGLRADNWQAEDNRATLNSMMAMAQPNPTYQAQRDEWLESGYLRFMQRAAHSDWYIGLGRATRFPDYWELVGNNRAGEASLSAFFTEPESTTQVDVAWRYFADTWRLTSSAYVGRVNDFILVQAASTMQPERVRNIDGAVYGAELAWQWSFAPAWQLASSMVASYGDNHTDHRPLAQQPPLEARISVTYQQQAWQFGTLWRAVQGQSRVAVGQGTIAGFDKQASSGFATLAANATWQVSPSQQLSFGVDNVFDRDYAEHLNKSAASIPGYPSQLQVPEPGRIWWLKWDYQLN